MLYIHIIIQTLILWCGCNVLPMLYLRHTNTMPLTFYISYFHQLFNESRRNHTVKHVGMPENRGPPYLQGICDTLNLKLKIQNVTNCTDI